MILRTELKLITINSLSISLREVNARIDEGDFAGDANLNGLAAVLAGSEDAFNMDLVEKCESWYQWMIGKLLFTQPDVKKFDLGRN